MGIELRRAKTKMRVGQNKLRALLNIFLQLPVVFQLAWGSSLFCRYSTTTQLEVRGAGLNDVAGLELVPGTLSQAGIAFKTRFLNSPKLDLIRFIERVTHWL